MRPASTLALTSAASPDSRRARGERGIDRVTGDVLELGVDRPAVAAEGGAGLEPCTSDTSARTVDVLTPSVV